MVDSPAVAVATPICPDVLERPSATVEGYDVVAGAHDLGQLDRLLCELGFRREDGSCTPTPGRITVFIGGVVDHDGYERPCAALVRELVDAGVALMTLGREEFAAIEQHVSLTGRRLLVAAPNTVRSTARSLSAGTLAPGPVRAARSITSGTAVTGPDGARRPAMPVGIDLAGWLMTVPLWLDLPGLRVVHSSWDHGAIARLKEAFGGNCLGGATTVRRAASSPRLREAVRSVFGLAAVSDERARPAVSGGPLVVTARSLGAEHPSTGGAVAYRHVGHQMLLGDRVLRIR